ncbi:kinectin-like isoform X4 [Tachysurus ichikawai]
MSKDSLIELLNLSIDSTEGSVVNFKTLHLLLYNLVNRHGAERETADRREADVGRDVTESLFASDTIEQLEDSEEGVSEVISSTSLMQDMVKEIQELKEEANNLKKEVGTLRNQLNQELKASIITPGISDTSREVTVFPTKKDQIQEMDKSLEVRLKHLEGEREYILGPESMSESLGDVEELSKSKVTASHGSESISGSEQQLHLQTADLRNAFQKLDKEMQNMKQELLVLIKEQKGSSEKEIQDKDLYKITKELEEKKADKKEVKIVEDFKADMQTLETKVLLCDTAADQLTRMIQDLASNICVHEENCQRINEKIFRELDSKLNYTEMDYLKRQLEECKMKIFQLDTQATDSYDAAVVRKHCLPKFNCLSCDRPLNMSIPGQPMLALPELPGLRPSKRSFDVQVNKENQDSSYVKTAEVSPPTEVGYCKNKDKVNQSQLPTSSGRKTKQLLSLQEQHPDTELICSGRSLTLTYISV